MHTCHRIYVKTELGPEHFAICVATSPYTYAGWCVQEIVLLHKPGQILDHLDDLFGINFVFRLWDMR